MTGINWAINLSVEWQIPARGSPETPRQGHGARDHRHRGGDSHRRVESKVRRTVKCRACL